MDLTPFFGSRDQLEPDEVLATWRIATLHIRVVRAIERIKNFRITHFIPSVLCPLAEHIVVCAFLTQFMEPLVPPPTNAVHAVPMPILQKSGNPPVIAEGRVDAETNVMKASTADQQSGSLDHKASLVPDMTAREMFGAGKRCEDYPTRSISSANKSSGKDMQVFLLRMRHVRSLGHAGIVDVATTTCVKMTMMKLAIFVIAVLPL